MNRIVKNIKYLRESNERTKKWVADQLGKTDTAIANYERSDSPPRVTVLQQYADLFGVYIGDLVGRDLWLGEGSSMLVSEPKPDYRLAREKEALHGMLDATEQRIGQLRAEISTLKKQMKGDPAAKDYLVTIEQVLAILGKDQ